MTTSELQAMQYFPVSRAYLCEDCHCVSNCSEYCPACASGSLMGLAGVLQRPEKPKECTALVLYERWAVEDPVLDCAIFILDQEYYRQMAEGPETVCV